MRQNFFQCFRETPSPGHSPLHRTAYRTSPTRERTCGPRSVLITRPPGKPLPQHVRNRTNPSSKCINLGGFPIPYNQISPVMQSSVPCLQMFTENSTGMPLQYPLIQKNHLVFSPNTGSMCLQTAKQFPQFSGS